MMTRMIVAINAKFSPRIFLMATLVLGPAKQKYSGWADQLSSASCAVLSLMGPSGALRISSAVK